MKSPLTRHNETRLHAISLLLANDYSLLTWILSEDRSDISSDPETLINQSKCLFSSGEQLLLLVALDLWNGSGNANIADLVDLDEVHFETFSMALEVAREI